MFRKLLALFACAAAAAAQTPAAAPPPVVHPVYPGAETPLGQRISALLADPSVSRAHWGIAVTAMDGTPIYGLNEGQYFRPASNAKIYTTTAAMAILGPNKTFTTNVYGKLDAATGTVQGDLTLAGSGDPSFGTDDIPYVAPANRPKNAPPSTQPMKDLNELVDQLVAKGVKRVTGNIVGDDTLFPWEPYPGSWDVGDLVWYYGAPVSALTIGDNQLKLTITPPGIVTLDQNGVDYYAVTNAIRAVPAGSKDTGIDVERVPGSRVLRVFGAMAADAKLDVEWIAVDDPAQYAAMLLRKLLVDRGIAVTGVAKTSHRSDVDARGFISQTREPTKCDASVVAGGTCPVDCLSWSYPPTLAAHVSAPLAADVTVTDKVSQNLHAELFLHALGNLTGCPSGSTVEGARVVRSFLLKAGLDPDDFLFYDGSGLSSHDITTPRASTQVLKYASTQPWFAQWKPALPIGGQDGSLASRFKDAPLKDHVFAKTGTLGESRALSGYLDAASGKSVIFSIMVDTHTPATSADRVVMDKIVAAIAAAN